MSKKGVLAGQCNGYPPGNQHIPPGEVRKIISPTIFQRHILVFLEGRISTYYVVDSKICCFLCSPLIIWGEDEPNLTVLRIYFSKWVGLVKFNHHHLLFMFSSACGCSCRLHRLKSFCFHGIFGWSLWGLMTGTSTMNDRIFPPVSWVVFRDVCWFCCIFVCCWLLQCWSSDFGLPQRYPCPVDLMRSFNGVSRIQRCITFTTWLHLTSDLTLKWWINSDDKKTHIIDR